MQSSKKTAKIDPFLLSKTLIFQRFFSIQTCILVKSLILRSVLQPIGTNVKKKAIYGPLIAIFLNCKAYEFIRYKTVFLKNMC